MLFSSIPFLNYFLPLFLAVYFITPRRAKNLVLLLSSLLFYWWGERIYVLLMLGATVAGWVFGLLIERFRGRRGAKIALIFSLVIELGLLAVFKYSDFFVNNINAVFHAELPSPGLLLPIGISFYIFQIISYLVDLHRGQTEVQRSLLKLATYVTLFPQLIAGPIVRYSTVAGELSDRRHTVQDFARGAFRFVLGLSKKVLLANVMGELVESFKSGGERSVLFVWLYVAAYALQIYFDFSGYSDMAIGLGRILGFHFMENFNYPYISKTITEFWRRWHISLGTWFRDYVYFPMGGNRVPVLRHIFNICVVWFLTGFWHGAAWNFALWGLYFAVFLLVEKYFLAKLLDRLPRIVSHLYLMLVISASWTLFDSPTLTLALGRMGLLFGIGADSLAGAESLYLLQKYLPTMVIGAVAATPLPKMIIERWIKRSEKRSHILTILEPVVMTVLFVLVTAYLIDGSFNPFIYLRF